MDDARHDVVPQEPASEARKAYTTPTLTAFGSVADITEGSPTGTGADSGVYS